MKLFTEEVIDVLKREDDEEILAELLNYYEFLKWKKQRSLENESLVESDEPEIEIQWYL